MRSWSYRRRAGPRIVRTEARNLEEACDLIAARQRGAKISQANKGKPRTLRQLSALYQHQAKRKPISLAKVSGGRSS